MQFDIVSPQEITEMTRRVIGDHFDDIEIPSFLSDITADTIDTMEFKFLISPPTSPRAAVKQVPFHTTRYYKVFKLVLAKMMKKLQASFPNDRCAKIMHEYVAIKTFADDPMTSEIFRDHVGKRLQDEMVLGTHWTTYLFSKIDEAH